MSHIPPSPNEACAICGHPLDDEQYFCSHCTAEINALGITETLKVNRKPTAVPKTQSQAVTFTADTQAMLQLLPSGTCITLPMKRPAVLGRCDGVLPTTSYRLIDLSLHHTSQHGISRRHCLIKRDEDRLILMDLGSTNGTYLNGEQLVAFLAYPLADGDRIVLSSLHLIISFTS